MFKNKKVVGGGVAAIILVVLIYACSGGGTPSCDSGEVKKEVIEYMMARYGKADFKYKLSNIVTDSVDKEAKKVECRAESNLLYDYGLGEKQIKPRYTAQRTSDGELIVKVK